MNFSIVSQVNPHVNLFFFSSRGAVGRPVTHRKGRGWRGGYLMTAIETMIKLDLSKYLKILKHLELLPRPLGQDWSAIWLQTFTGTITLSPKIHIIDFYYLLSDPTPERLARMMQAGQQSTFPKLLFIENRMKIERLIEKGLLVPNNGASGNDGGGSDRPSHTHGQQVPTSCNSAGESSVSENIPAEPKAHRRLSMLEEIRRQSGVFFDDDEDEFDASESDLDHGTDKSLGKL
ncbi:MAG: hypothetical protein Q9222_001629 [Ikaeria aurantiellina]